MATLILRTGHSTYGFDAMLENVARFQVAGGSTDSLAEIAPELGQGRR
ncbi:hypothetical protein [Candidatus Puniceispirillum sp.]